MMEAVLSRFLPTLVNTVAVLAGSGVGLLLHGRIAPRYRLILFQTIGLLTLLIGFREALTSQDIPLLALGLIGGALLGEKLNLESSLENAGKHLQRLTRHDGQEGFVEGFVYASLLFCVGALTIVGCLQAAVEGDGELLYTKSLLDGHVAIFLTGAMGAGVMAASVTILLFQGGLTLFFLWAGPHLPEPVIREMGAAGGLLIIAIGLNLLEIATIRVGNLLPGMFLGALLFWWKSNGFAF